MVRHLSLASLRSLAKHRGLRLSHMSISGVHVKMYNERSAGSKTHTILEDLTSQRAEMKLFLVSEMVTDYSKLSHFVLTIRPTVRTFW